MRKVVEERYSFPLFFNVDYDTEVKPLAQFASPDGVDRRRCRRRAPVRPDRTVVPVSAPPLESGELVLPEGSVGLNQREFGQEARHTPPVPSTA